MVYVMVMKQKDLLQKLLRRYQLKKTITQEFIAREYYLKGIEFVFINLAEDGNGELDFRVLDSDGRIKANSENCHFFCYSG